MRKRPFRPQLEALDPRVLPDANPLAAGIVGPFAPGLYPSDPPLAGTGGHNHEWLVDIHERTDAIESRAAAREDQTDAQYTQLQDTTGVAQALRPRLETVLADLERRRDAAQSAATHAQEQVVRLRQARLFDAARVARTNYLGHIAARERAISLIGELQDLLSTADAQLVQEANGELAALRDETRSVQGQADDAAQRVNDLGPSAPVPQRLSAERAWRRATEQHRLTEACYDGVSRAIRDTARQFGQ
jgi:hypothetical protein